MWKSLAKRHTWKSVRLLVVKQTEVDVDENEFKSKKEMMGGSRVAGYLQIVYQLGLLRGEMGSIEQVMDLHAHLVV
jgi:hypothetical protein